MENEKKKQIATTSVCDLKTNKQRQMHCPSCPRSGEAGRGDYITMFLVRTSTYPMLTIDMKWQ